MRFSNLLASPAILAVVLLLTQSVMASDYLFSGSGSGTICSPAQPCTFSEAVSEAATDPSVQIGCADSTPNSFGVTITHSVTINCAGTNGSIGAITIADGAIVVLRNLRVDLNSVLITLQNGTLIMDNVQLSSAFQNAILAQPSSASKIVLKNCLIDSSASGILLKPAAGGSINATLDHVVITGNTGIGISTDSADGTINLDITDSEISYNGSVGVNARSGGSQNMVSIKNSVITKNSAQGVHANGANVGITVQTTLLDQNVGGATSIVLGGHITTYGNNSIIGSSGSGFSGTASLQ
jgi:Right handed beta helix region